MTSLKNDGCSTKQAEYYNFLRADFTRKTSLANMEIIYQEIEDILNPFKNLAEGDVMQKDRNSNLEFLGIRMPILRKITKEGFSFSNKPYQEVFSIWDNVWHNSNNYESMMLCCIYYSQQKNLIPMSLWNGLSFWIKIVDNWDIADHLAKIYSYLLPKNLDSFSSKILEWNNSNNQWERRISIVCLIRYTGKNAVYLPLEYVLPKVENCLEDDRYYVQTAVGWVIRELGRKFPQKMKEFIQKNLQIMSSKAFSRAISFLNSNEIKEMRTLKSNLKKQNH